MSARRGPGARTGLVALTALAAVLRFSTLDLQSFWLDEAATVEAIRHGFGGMLDRVSASESTPPLYYVVAWAWSKAFGHGEVGLRSLSALAGTAFVPAAYAAASELCSRRVGLAVAALAAVNPVLWWYSQEVRAYSLLALLAALGLWAFARALDDEPGSRALGAWAVVSALAMATHYFAAFLVLPQAIWLLTRKGSDPLSVRDSRGLTPLVAVAVVVAAGLALAPLALHQRSLGLAEFIAGDSLAERLARAAKNMLVGFDSPLEIAVAVAAALIAAAGVASAVALLRGRERSGAWLAGGIGVVALAIPLVLALLGADYLDTRNLLAVWLPLMIVVAAGLAAGRIGRVGLVLLCLLGLTAVVSVMLTPAWQRDDWRGMAATLGPPDGPRGLVIQPASGQTPLRIYLPHLRPLPETGAGVQEIVVMTPVRRDVDGDHPAPPPRNVPPQLPGFELAARRLTSTYTVMVFRSKSPKPLTPVQGSALGFRANEPISLELQTPGTRP